jgi:hypothetical protein
MRPDDAVCYMRQRRDEPVEQERREGRIDRLTERSLGPERDDRVDIASPA